MAGLFGIGSGTSLTYIGSASGIITEFIGAIFFYLYSKTVRQMKEYHDSLLAVQNILLSFRLVGDIKNDELKTKMIGQMLEYLVRKAGAWRLHVNHETTSPQFGRMDNW